MDKMNNILNKILNKMLFLALGLIFLILPMIVATTNTLDSLSFNSGFVSGIGLTGWMLLSNKDDKKDK